MEHSEEDQQAIIKQASRQLADIIYQYIYWREKQKVQRGEDEKPPLTQP